MLHLADRRPAVRQNLAVGRVSERITGRGLTFTAATLSARRDAGPPVPLAVRFLRRAEGYFAFSIMPGRDMPDFSAAANVTLQAEFQLGSRPPVTVERTVAASVLALIETQRTIAGREVILRTVSGAPVQLSAAVDPARVALRGIVLHDHDPAQPAAGVAVAIAAGPPQAETDAQGRFFLPALPLDAEVVINLTEDGTTTNHPVHVDYSKPVNNVALSLPG